MNVHKFFLIGQSQTRYANGSYISYMIGMKYGNSVQELPQGSANQAKCKRY
jgi:hypothetical protein